MKYPFHPEGEVEFLEAIDFCEDCETGLGYDFAIEIHAAIQNILSFPGAWAVLEHEIRRCQVRRFPYGVVYFRDGTHCLRAHRDAPASRS